MWIVKNLERTQELRKELNRMQNIRQFHNMQPNSFQNLDRTQELRKELKPYAEYQAISQYTTRFFPCLNLIRFYMWVMQQYTNKEELLTSMLMLIYSI